MIVLRISRASFQEIALLLCSSRNNRLCKTAKYDKWRMPVQDGQIKRIDLPGLRLEPV